MSYPHWEYFLVIESDLEATSRFVEFTEGNFKTHSVEFAKIILTSGSEIDVVAKAFCNQIKETGTYKNIDDYRKTVTSEFRNFYNNEIKIPRYGLTFKPWESWGNSGNPAWWDSYNKVKHNRDEYYHLANLENAISSVAGLFSLMLYYYQRNLPDFEPRTKLMTNRALPEVVWCGVGDLPDFKSGFKIKHDKN